MSRFLQTLKSLRRADGCAIAWTRITHSAELHQTATVTKPNRYPALFDLITGLLPADANILSFGCSTGEELLALRSRLPEARIVGVEINARARRIARKLTVSDARIKVIEQLPLEQFHAVLALAVLQREPHLIEERAVTNLSSHYPFARFDRAILALAERIREGGLLAVFHTHYRVEDSSAAAYFTAVPGAPPLDTQLFDRSSQLYQPSPTAASLFVKGTARA